MAIVMAVWSTFFFCPLLSIMDSFITRTNFSGSIPNSPLLRDNISLSQIYFSSIAEFLNSVIPKFLTSFRCSDFIFSWSKYYSNSHVGKKKSFSFNLKSSEYVLRNSVQIPVLGGAWACPFAGIRF